MHGLGLFIIFLSKEAQLIASQYNPVLAVGLSLGLQVADAAKLLDLFI